MALQMSTGVNCVRSKSADHAVTTQHLWGFIFPTELL